MGLAHAMDIKLAEEERRRLEAQRQHRQLQYAAAVPLPDEAPTAPGELHSCDVACALDNAGRVWAPDTCLLDNQLPMWTLYLL